MRPIEGRGRNSRYRRSLGKTVWLSSAAHSFGQDSYMVLINRSEPRQKRLPWRKDATARVKEGKGTLTEMVKRDGASVSREVGRWRNLGSCHLEDIYEKSIFIVSPEQQGTERDDCESVQSDVLLSSPLMKLQGCPCSNSDACR